MTLKLVQEKRGNVPPASFVLNALLPKVSFFLPPPVNTFVAAENVPLIRCSGFAERERDLCLAYFSSFFPLKLVILHKYSIPASLSKSTIKTKYSNKKIVFTFRFSLIKITFG